MSDLIISLKCPKCGHSKAVSEKDAFNNKHYCVICETILWLCGTIPCYPKK